MKLHILFKLLLPIAIALNLLGGMFVKPPPSADDAVDDGINKPSDEVLVTPSAVDDQIALIENSGLRKETQDILFKHLDDFEVDKKALDAILGVQDDFVRLHGRFGDGFVQLGIDDVDDYVRFVAENEERIAILVSDNSRRLSTDEVFKLVGYNYEFTFEPDDMVYGLTDGGRLRTKQQLCGGKTLTDVANNFDDWNEVSYETILNTRDSGNKVHFDLTNVREIKGIFDNTAYTGAKNVTANELRFIKANWETLKTTVIFYKNGKQYPNNIPWEELEVLLYG